MAIFDLLSNSAVQQLIGDGLQTVGIPKMATDQILAAATGHAKKILDHFGDHSQKFTQVLQRANLQAWQVLEMAIAEEVGGGTLWQRVQGLLASGDNKALAQQARAFFQERLQLPAVSGERKTFYRNCLNELQAARKAKLLSQGSWSPAHLQQQAGHFARFVDRQNLVTAQQEAMAQVSVELAAAGHRTLAGLLRVPIGKDHCLLLTLTRSFFLRAIEKDTELFQGLAFERLQFISVAQKDGFESLSGLLETHSEQLEEMLFGVQELVIETREGVQQANEKLDQTNHMLETLLRSLGASGTRQLQALDIGSRDDDGNRAQVEQVRRQVHALGGVNRNVSRVYSNLGKAEMLTGNLEAAWLEFSRAAEMAEEPKEKAAAHYHLYRIALERANLSHKSEDLDAALSQLKLAINKDQSHMPFDVRKYQPVKILGAGGFGVTFLCKRKPLMDQVAVKSLTQENLERNSDEVFSEGMLLRELDHPSIIRMIDGDYVDHERKANPYFVMDFFDGSTLEAQIEKHGPPPLEDVVELGKQIAEGLQAAHQRRIWHRDIKPANVMVRKDESGWRVKIIDFGLALRRDLQVSSNASTSKKSKTTMGKALAYTEDYAAPEQKDPARQNQIGPVSDIFCFGKTMYYALFKTPRPDYDDLETLPENLKRLLTRCAAERIDRRPQSFVEVLQELKKVEFELAPVMELVEEAPLQVLPAPPAPPPVVAKEWYYAHAGQQSGPVTELELLALFKQNKVSSSDLVWKKGLAGWVTATAAFPNAIAPPPPPPAPPPPKPKTNNAQLRLFWPGKGFMAMSGTVKLKVYVDDQFVDESPLNKGFDLRLELSPAKHKLQVVLWDDKGEADRKHFDLELTRIGEYEIRFNCIWTPPNLFEAFSGAKANIQKSTLDIMRQPR